MPHDESSLFMEQPALKGLGEEVASHFQCRAIHHPQVAFPDLIVDKEKPDVESPCPLAGTALSVLGKDYCTLIVLH